MLAEDVLAKALRMPTGRSLIGTGEDYEAGRAECGHILFISCARRRSDAMCRPFAYASSDARLLVVVPAKVGPGTDTNNSDSKTGASINCK